MKAAHWLRLVTTVILLAGPTALASAQNRNTDGNRGGDAREGVRSSPAQNYAATIRQYRGGTDKGDERYSASSRRDARDLGGDHGRWNDTTDKKYKEYQKPRNGVSPSKPVAVSEPSTSWLLGIGLALLGVVAWRRRKA